jgi:streptogramin lyase
VLFLDIVGSTALATELGDARWRELLTRFRRLVRAELKHFGGREQDTAGDGFFATFSEPVQALRAAAGIAAHVQELGIDVRAGVHTGEAEEIDGKLGGIAVHVASRVMGLAGAAEVLATNTVKDLVAGSSASFEDRGTHELKGVEGSRPIYALTEIGVPLPQPLSPGEAAERLAQVMPSHLPEPRRLALVLAGVAIGIAAVIGAIVALRGGGGSASVGQIDLLRLDARTQTIADIVHGKPAGRGVWQNLGTKDGTLWQAAGRDQVRLLARDLRTGAVKQTVKLTPSTIWAQPGFGAVWILENQPLTSGPHSGENRAVVRRVDALSGRLLAKIVVGGNAGNGTIATGNGAVWVLEGGGELFRIDPGTNRVTRTYETKAVETGILVPQSGYEWICECVISKVMRVDGRTGETRTFRIPTQSFLIDTADASGDTVWFLDPQGATLTALDPRTGKPEAPLGLNGKPQQAVVAFGAVWIAAGRVVDRVDLATSEHKKTVIQMPLGMWAGGIAADAATHSLWVGNSGFAPPR